MNFRSCVKKVGTVMVGTLAVLALSTQSALADDDLPPSIEEDSYYIQKFVVSAYYSPLPDQEYYVTGSYQGDITLNGNGTHGADGTPVYPYMLAAPKKYDFGTQIELPGFGVLEVHDRGGAIISGADYDRLDIYMGAGDEGLDRALEFGKRVIYGKVFSDQIATPKKIDDFKPSTPKKNNKVVIAKNQFDLGSKEDLEQVQKMLKALGYFYGEVTGNFDVKTSVALNRFQVDYGIAKSSTVEFAGQYGQKTRDAIVQVFQTNKEKYLELLPKIDLGLNANGEEVQNLRIALKRLGYVKNDERDDFSEDLESKLIDFQIDMEIIDDESDFGAGYYGPKTRARLTEAILAEGLYDEENLPEITKLPEDYASINLFTKDLKTGDKGEEVTKLQETLVEFKYLDIEPTGYYGDVTTHAVMKFKQAANLFEEGEELNGNFDMKIRKKINDIIIARTQAEYFIELNAGLIEY